MCKFAGIFSARGRDYPLKIVFIMSYDDTLKRLRSSGNFRSIPSDTSGRGGAIDLSSNDYLGLASREDLRDEFFASIASNPPALSASASRLLAASQEAHHSLEETLAGLYRRPVLLFNSGYHANTGLLGALASEPKTLIVADKLVHASMIDGIVLSRAPFRRFRHNDLNALESILRKEASGYERVIVAVESVYSMDGDRADLQALVELKRMFPSVMLYVDEAHSFGAKGQKGLGLAAEMADFEEIDIVVGTFGKAAASVGAFCAASPLIRDYAINRARSFIFSTALPPLNSAWTEFIIRRLPMMTEERERLSLLEQTLHKALAPLPEEMRPARASHIVPVITGDARLTVALSGRLLDEGFKVLPIRTPTVPPGTERLRISLSAAIDPEQIRRFATILTDLCKSH